MQPKPVISIVMAVYNGAQTIQACLDSVIAQSYSNWELVVVDGGSSDGTVDIIQRNSSAISYWLSEADSGLYDAWNKALDHISGNWIYFIGADDRLYSNRTMECVIDFILRSDSSVDLVCGGVEMINKESKFQLVAEPDQFPMRMLPHQGLFHARALFLDGNKFSTAFRIRGDYEFLARANSLHKLQILMIPNLIVASCQSGGLSSSAKVRMKCFLETFRIRKAYGLQPYSLEMIKFFLKAIILRSAFRLGLVK